jgi:hypothetical protein
MISVDGTHCHINEPRKEPSLGWYSKKHNKAGLAYDLGITIRSNTLVWINDPFPAGQNDISIYRKPNGLKSKIPANKRVIGDEGYKGEPEQISIHNPFDIPAIRELKHRAKARHMHRSHLPLLKLFLLSKLYSLVVDRVLCRCLHSTPGAVGSLLCGPCLSYTGLSPALV